MNANELIKRMEDGYSVSYDEIIAMLRQQQAEIEALKAGKIRAYDNGVEDGRKPNTNLVKELTERIKKLETALQGWEIGFERMGYERLLKDKDEYIAELLNEPVKEQDESFDRTASHMAGEYVSHPVKELTDEEIVAVWDKDCVVLDEDKLVIRFARAILRKAQEK